MFHDDGTESRYCKYCDTYIWEGHPHIELENQWFCDECSYLKGHINEEVFIGMHCSTPADDFAVTSRMEIVWFRSERPGYPEAHSKHEPKRATLKEYKRKRDKFYRILSIKDGEYCKHCGSEDVLCVDHIRPISRGGKNKIENMQLLCRKCNSSKSNFTMKEWEDQDFGSR